MQIIPFDVLRPRPGASPVFEGYRYDANLSFFVVSSEPNTGAPKHRHPYEEVWVILNGDIEVIVDGVQQMVTPGHVVVIPPNTWHEFKNRSDVDCLMVNIHAAPKMIQENWKAT